MEIENNNLFEEELKEIENEKIEKEVENMDNSDLEVRDSLSMFFQEMKNYPLLSCGREKKLTRLYRKGNKAERKLAKEILINSNLRLVVYNAKKYAHVSNIAIDDLIQEGIIGLMYGIEKFDYKSGYKLSTYVTFWIRQSITRYISNNGRMIRLPVHIHEKLGRYSKAKKDYINKKGFEPDDKTMAKLLKTSVRDLEYLRNSTQDTISLDKKISEDDDATIADTISDSTSVSPEEYASSVLLKEEIDNLLSTLKEREKQVIILRYGLDDNVPKTLETIGSKLHVTRERARQIESVALNKLRCRGKHLQSALY